MEVGQDFSNWIKSRIKKYGYVENVDFVLGQTSERENKGLQGRIGYHLTLEMAKEISMVERNQNGKEARQYFIECEKIAQQPIDPIMMKTSKPNRQEIRLHQLKDQSRQ